jgi:hypothetical protein
LLDDQRRPNNINVSVDSVKNNYFSTTTTTTVLWIPNQPDLELADGVRRNVTPLAASQSTTASSSNTNTSSLSTESQRYVILFNRDFDITKRKPFPR